MAHRAAGMRSPAHLHDIGIAENDAHLLNRYTDEVRNDLGKAGLVSLTARLRANHHIDKAIRPHGDARLFLGSPDRGFHIIDDAEAEQLAALPGFALPPGKTFTVGDLHRPVHVLLV